MKSWFSGGSIVASDAGAVGEHGRNSPPMELACADALLQTRRGSVERGNVFTAPLEPQEPQVFPPELRTVIAADNEPLGSRSVGLLGWQGDERHSPVCLPLPPAAVDELFMRRTSDKRDHARERQREETPRQNVCRRYGIHRSFLLVCRRIVASPGALDLTSMAIIGLPFRPRQPVKSNMGRSYISMPGRVSSAVTLRPCSRPGKLLRRFLDIASLKTSLVIDAHCF